MKWQEIKLTTTQEAAEAAANVFFEIGVQGVVIEDTNSGTEEFKEEVWGEEKKAGVVPQDTVIIKGYLPVDSKLEDKLCSFRERMIGLQDFFEEYSADVSTEQITEEDWANNWKKYFKINRIGKKLVICPPWEEYTAAPGEVIIKINPESAFGTGSHTTTLQCLVLLEKYIKDSPIVFDVGCGSGILSIAAAKLGAHCVYARDIAPEAIQSAKRNLILNEIEKKVEVEGGNFLNNVKGQAHIIVANIIANSIIELAPQAFERLVPGGLFISSGIISKRRREVETELKNAGFTIEEVRKDNDWVAIVCKK